MSELLEQTPPPQNCGHAPDYRCANCDPEWIESPTTLIGSDADTQREPVQPDIEALKTELIEAAGNHQLRASLMWNYIRAQQARIEELEGERDLFESETNEFIATISDMEKEHKEERDQLEYGRDDNEKEITSLTEQVESAEEVAKRWEGIKAEEPELMHEAFEAAMHGCAKELRDALGEVHDE